VYKRKTGDAFEYEGKPNYKKQKNSSKKMKNLIQLNSAISDISEPYKT